MFHPVSPSSIKSDPTIHRLKLVGVVAWLTLFLGGLIGHQGSWWVYTVFTVVFTVVLLSGVRRQPSYGYMFLAIFLWLGFWLKLAVHNIFRYGYPEPMGIFDGSSAAWDEVLWVATVAGAGIFLARCSYVFLTRGAVTTTFMDGSRVPSWYPPARNWLWILLVVTTAALAALNSIYGIQQSGLAPRTILMWPMNGLIYWLLSTGLSMGVATLLWWDICLKKDISLSIYALFGEAFLSTMSLLSRGLFLFHIIPPLVVIVRNRQSLVWRSQRKFFLMVMILGALFVVSLSVVGTLRSYLYQTGQDFRSSTQNRITRLQILQSVIPTLEERILIKGTGRLEVLQGLIPQVEKLIHSTEMTQSERLRRMKIHSLENDVPLDVQLETFRMEHAWLERNLAALTQDAVAAKRLKDVSAPVLEEDAFLEDAFQAMVLEKADIQGELSERKSQLTATNAPWFLKSRLLLDEFGYQITSGLGNRIFTLGVDRWIGIEGVAAISSYPEKSSSLFMTALTERSGMDDVPLYQKICQSIYQTVDTNKYNFASLPGAAAFFYYTGSLMFVFLGMFFLTLVAIYSEHLAHHLTGNVLVCALVGMNAANAIAQLGVVPRQLLIHFGMLFGAVFIIWLLQSRKVVELTHRFFRSTPSM